MNTIAQYPDFSQLDETVRNDFESFTSNFDAFSDLSYATLRIWWSNGQNARVAQLNNNMIIEYIVPNDVVNSGLSLVGVTSIKDTVDTIFKEEQQLGRSQRLVHVPEFTVKALDEHGYTIEGEPDYDEYLLSTEELATLEGSKHSRTRRKVARYLREAGDVTHDTKVFDLDDKDTVDTLLDFSAKCMQESTTHNDQKGDETLAIEKSIRQARDIGMKALGFYTDSNLQGLVIFQDGHDAKSIIVNHIKVSNQIPHAFDYATHVTAKYALERGIPIINFEMDLGIEGLRFHKTGLRPIGFNRKFTITQA